MMTYSYGLIKYVLIKKASRRGISKWPSWRISIDRVGKREFDEHSHLAFSLFEKMAPRAKKEALEEEILFEMAKIDVEVFLAYCEGSTWYHS
jgi:hypothetical protein